MYVTAEIALTGCVRSPSLFAARPKERREEVAYIWDTETWLFWNPQAGRNGAWREVGVGGLSPEEFALYLEPDEKTEWELVAMIIVEMGR